MQNLLNWLRFLIQGEAHDLYEVGRNHAVHTLRMLKLTIVVPLIVLVIGICLPASAARIVIGVSFFLSLGLVTLVLARTYFFKEVILLGSALGGSIWKHVPFLGKRIEFPLTDEKHQKKLNDMFDWLAATLVWSVSASVFALTFSVWEDSARAIYIFGLGFLIALMAALKWFNGKLGRFCYKAMVAANIVWLALWFASPDYVRRWTEDKKAVAKAHFQRNHELATVDAKYASEETQVAKETYESLKRQRLEIRRRAAIDCGAQVCPSQKEELARINAALRAIDGNTWLDSVEEAKKSPAPAPNVPAAVVSGSTASGQPFLTEEQYQDVMRRLQ